MKQHCCSQVHLTRNSLPVMTWKCVCSVRSQASWLSHPFVQGRRCLKPKWLHEPRSSVPVQQTGDNTDEHLLIPVCFGTFQTYWRTSLWKKICEGKWFKRPGERLDRMECAPLGQHCQFLAPRTHKTNPWLWGRHPDWLLWWKRGWKFHSSLSASEQMISQRGS